MPRWSDDPSHLIGVIKNYLRLTDQDRSPSDQFAEGNEQAEQMVVELVGRASPRAASAPGRRVRPSAGPPAGGPAGRPKFMLVVALAAVRQQLGLVGEILADRERIARLRRRLLPRLAEARRGLAGSDLSTLIEQRGRPTSSSCVAGVPRVLLSDGTEPEAVGAAGVRTVLWWAVRRRPEW